MRTVLDVALAEWPRPWGLFASSRKVYGQPARLPVSEADPRRPMNIYRRAKAEAERLVGEACEHDLTAAGVRSSNVGGAIAHHADRADAVGQASAVSRR